MKSKKPDKKSSPVETVIFAFFILASMFLFDLQKPWAALIFVLSCACVYLYYFKNAKPGKKYGINPGIFLYISFAFIALKFFKIFSFPPDFFGDESTYIFTPHAILNGYAGLFDYNVKFGISLPYICNLVSAAVMKIAGYHLNWLRFIPVLVFIATAFGLWKLAPLMKMPDSAAAFVFVYALSEWAWKLSKLYLPNFYIPLFIVFFLVLFYSAVNTGSMLALAGAGLIFAAGFFTYGTWILMAPFAIYLAFEYRKELGNKKLSVFLGIVVISSVVILLIYLFKRPLAETITSRTVFAAGTGSLNAVAGIFINLYRFFLSTIDTDMSFMPAPFFYAVEVMLLIFGLIHISLNIKIRENRIVLAGFIISLATVMFGASVSYPVRHAMAFTFAALICGIGLRSAGTNKKFFFFLIPVYVFSALSFMLVYYFAWGSSMPQTMIDRSMAAYINTTYGDKALYVNDTEPFGRYMAFLRTKAAYRDKNDGGFNYAVFSTPVLWRKSMKDAFPDIEVKYFFEGGPGTALWSFPMSGHPEAAQFFMNMAKNLSAVDSLIWKEDYDAALNALRSKISAPENIYVVLQNTFLKVHESTIYVKKRDLRKLAECMMNTPGVLELPTDYYFDGVLFETNMQYVEAYKLFERASMLAPEWVAPRAKMQRMKYLDKYGK